MKEIMAHYDSLIAESNDPVRDGPMLQAYMDKWDGDVFFDQLKLNSTKTVLEIGVGTGRLAIKVIPHCKHFTGIDFSAKTIERAGQNLAAFQNKTLIRADFFAYDFDKQFDIVYSSLTFFHFQDKQKAIHKIANLLAKGGRFVLSISKDQSEEADFGRRRISLFPDNPQEIKNCLRTAKLTPIHEIETAFAWIITSTNC